MRNATVKPDILDVTPDRMKEFGQHISSDQITEEDRSILHSLIFTYMHMRQRLANNTLTLAELKRLVGLEQKQETSPETPGDSAPTSPPEPDVERPKRPGHGRYSADAYKDANRIR